LLYVTKQELEVFYSWLIPGLFDNSYALSAIRRARQHARSMHQPVDGMTK
jgi:hypothetical protein